MQNVFFGYFRTLLLFVRIHILTQSPDENEPASSLQNNAYAMQYKFGKVIFYVTFIHHHPRIFVKINSPSKSESIAVSQ
jgi:hypothetical protein